MLPHLTAVLLLLSAPVLLLRSAPMQLHTSHSYKHTYMHTIIAISDELTADLG